MIPTPRRLPLWTASLLLGGMGLFILRDWFPTPVENALTAGGLAVFAAGLIVALVGMIWSIATLTSPLLRRARGITTPVVTILIAAFAWSGTWWTYRSFHQAQTVHLQADASNAATRAGIASIPAPDTESGAAPYASTVSGPDRTHDPAP